MKASVWQPSAALAALLERAIEPGPGPVNFGAVPARSPSWRGSGFNAARTPLKPALERDA